ncbi:hypothetical protein [Mangrovicoccus ximenensis]|uniref:hypothetical protein n=1 Tax=Mangrovicoccus ximenensis TaxID=1911570 RepID=UPI000D38BDF1|nr:hypothetical protein [Mangrovicoccus ximenensis]
MDRNDRHANARRRRQPCAPPARHPQPVRRPIGEGPLCARYAQAFRQLLGRGPAAQPGNTAPAGLFGFAAAAGLLDGPMETGHD